MADEPATAPAATEDTNTTADLSTRSGSHAVSDLGPSEEQLKEMAEFGALRKRAEAAEAELEKFRNEKLTAEERRDKELEAARSQLDANTAETRALRVQLVAARLGFVDPEDAAALLPAGAVDDPSDTKALEGALKGLAKAKPYLVGGASGTNIDQGAGRSEQIGQPGSMNDLIRRASGRA